MNWLKTSFMRIIGAGRSIVSNSKAVAIFAPESVGSVGDQAMVEVMREQLTARQFKPTFVYLPGWTAIPLRRDAPTVMLKSASNLSLQYWRTVMRSNAMAAIGADVLDGVYGTTLPLRWAGKLVRAREAGNKVGIINFSFSPEADPAVSKTLGSTREFTFTPRDPVSYSRFTSATGRAATLSADLAFLLTPELRSPNAHQADSWLLARKLAGDTILFVNLSGHTLSRMSGDGIAVMGDVLGQWLRADTARSVFMVPHDFRPAPTGDVEALDQLRAVLASEFPDRVEMIRPPFAAWDVKALCAHADLGVSGRMHLSIACLGMGVPVVSVVYVGKFEGLMQHIGLADEDLLLSTEEALQADRLLSRIERVTADHKRLSDLIQANLPSVRALSEKNFDWM